MMILLNIFKTLTSGHGEVCCCAAELVAGRQPIVAVEAGGVRIPQPESQGAARVALLQGPGGRRGEAGGMKSVNHVFYRR